MTHPRRKLLVLSALLAGIVALLACSGSTKPNMAGMDMSASQRATAYSQLLASATPSSDGAMGATNAAAMAMDAPLGAVLCPQTPVVTNAALPTATTIRVTQDDLVARITWTPYYSWSPSLPSGVGGYLLTWGPSGGTQVCNLAFDQFDAQLLVAGTNYTMAIQAIGIDGRTGPAVTSFNRRSYTADGSTGALTAGATTFASDTTRVTALRSSMTGFFYDGDSSNGTPEYLDPDKFTTAFSACDNPATTGVFVNAQDHFHTESGSNIDGYPPGSLGYCDRAQATLRPHAMPDFTTGLDAATPTITGAETLSNLVEPVAYRTIVVDVDGPVGQRDKTYVDLIQRSDNQPTDVTGSVNVGSPFTSNTPFDLRLQVAQNIAQIFYAGANGQMNPVAFPFSSCDMTCLTSAVQTGNAGGIEQISLLPNVRHSVVLHIGQPSHIDVWMDGEKVLNYDGLTLTGAALMTHPTLLLNTFSYNSPKDGTTDTLNHWDNLGFDGPAQTSVVYNYTDGQVSSEKFHKVGGTYSDTVKMPDALTAATDVRLMFNQQTAVNQSYGYCSTDKVSVNGHDFPLSTPSSTSGSGPGDTVGTYSPYQNVIDALPKADFLTGDNAIVFTLCNSGVLNVHVEVTYPVGSAPTLTPWYTSWAQAVVMPPTIPQGCWSNYTRINSTANSAQNWAIFQHEPIGTQHAPLTVSGSTVLSYVADCMVQLKTGGKYLGIHSLAITLDGVTIATPVNSPNEPVPSVPNGTYTLDTTTIPNGQHELDLVAVDDAGNPMAPGYFEQFNYTGSDAPILLDVENAGSTVTPSPTPGPGTATPSPTPSPTPIVTPSPSPSPTASPSATPTVVPPTATPSPAPTSSPTPQPTPNPADPCNTAGTNAVIASLTQASVGTSGVARALALAEIWATCEGNHGTLPPTP